MQFVESSVVGIIEVDSSSPIDFKVLADRSHVATTGEDDAPTFSRATSSRCPHRYTVHQEGVSLSDSVSCGHPVLAARIPRREFSGSGPVHADLPRLQQDLETELTQLRREMASLPRLANS